MTKNEVKPEELQALSITVYAIYGALVANGNLCSGVVQARLRQLLPANNPELHDALSTIIVGLQGAEGLMRQGPMRGVIDGGAPEDQSE